MTFTTYAEGFYDPADESLDLFYGSEEEEPGEDIDPECCCHLNPGECEIHEPEYEGPDPDAQLEEYHWRLSSLY